MNTTDRLFNLSTLFLTAFVWTALQCFPAFGQAGLPEIKRLIDNENYDQAIAAANQEIPASKDAKAHYYKAIAYFYKSMDENMPANEANALRGAIRPIASDALGKTKKASYGYITMGLAEFIAGNAAGAKTQLDLAIEKAPNDVASLLEIANVYKAAVEFETSKPSKGNADTRKMGVNEATTVLTKAEAYDKKNPEIYTALGRLWEIQKVSELPEINYKKAIDINPSNPNAQYALATYLVKQKKYKDAEPILTKVIELDPKFAPAYKDLSDIYFNTAGDDKRFYKKSLEYATKWRDLLGNSKSARARYAVLLYLIGLYSDAVPAFEDIMKDSTNLVFDRLYGYCLVESQKYPEGKAQLDKYFQKAKADQLVNKDYKYYGLALEKSGQPDQAIEYYQKAITADPSQTTLNKNIADIYKEKKEWPKYVEYLERYLEKHPNLTDQFYLGFSLLNNVKDYNKAEAVFTKILATKPDLIEAHYYLAQTNVRRDTSQSKASAIPHYENMSKYIYKFKQENDAGKKKFLAEGGTRIFFYYYGKKDYSKALGMSKLILANDAIDPKNKTNVQQTVDYINSQTKDAVPFDWVAEWTK
jgi:tetratricopeptide (TPR) repeat protein